MLVLFLIGGVAKQWLRHLFFIFEDARMGINLGEEFDTVSGSNSGAVMEVEKPDGTVARDDSGKAIYTITLLGVDSAEYKKAANANLNRRLTKRNMKITAEELEIEGIDTLVAVTKEWSGFKGGDGKPLPCTAANVRSLYRDYPVIREQADKFVNERTNFLVKSKAS